MKECSELVLLEKYIDNQMFLMENAEIMESADLNFEDDYFQESASSASLDSIMESADDKKKNIFGRIWDGFKKIVQRFANFLIKCAGGDTTEDLKDKVKKLKEEVDKNSKEAADTLAKLKQVQDELNISAVALSSEKEKYSRTLSEKHAVVAKWQHKLVAANKDLAAQKAENERLNKENETYKSMSATASSTADQYKAMYDDMAKGFMALSVKDRNGGKACDINFLVDVINRFGDALNSGNTSSLAGIKKSIETEINRARAEGIILNFHANTLKLMADKLNSALKDVNAEEKSSQLNGTGYVEARNVYSMLQESVGATCALISKAIKFNAARKKYIDQFKSSVSNPSA